MVASAFHQILEVPVKKKLNKLLLVANFFQGNLSVVMLIAWIALLLCLSTPGKLMRYDKLSKKNLDWRNEMNFSFKSSELGWPVSLRRASPSDDISFKTCQFAA